MRKNYFLIELFALATITFAACSSEDKLGEERSDDNGNTEVIEESLLGRSLHLNWAKMVL